MLQLIISFVVKNILSAAGVWCINQGIATDSEWKTILGVVSAAIAWVWHWHESHAAAVASGKVQPVALSPKAAGAVALIILLGLFATGCKLPNDVAHVYTISADGTSLGVTQNPATQAYELGLKRVHTHVSIIPIMWQSTSNGLMVAVIPDTVVSDEINARSGIFGGAGGTITVATGTNAVATLLGGGHVPINEGTGTNLPK